MATSIPALVNPTLLVWAREESGFALEPVAKRLNVKPERLLAWERGELTPTVRQDGYQRWKEAWGEYLATLRPRAGGFATPVEKALGRGGRPFAQLVIEAMDSNRVTAVQACRYLDLRFEHFEKLRTKLREDLGVARTMDDGD